MSVESGRGFCCYVQIGKGRVRREGADVALVGYGAMVSACLTAADMLSQQGVSATVVDARFCKPLDAELLRQARLRARRFDPQTLILRRYAVVICLRFCVRSGVTCVTSLGTCQAQPRSAAQHR